MQTYHRQQDLTETLLRHLRSEEDLLRESLAGITAIHTALRRGDLAAALALSNQQQTQAESLREAAKGRADAATALAWELGLTGEELTLSALAAKLPDTLAADVRAIQTRLSAVTTELTAIQTRNANLLGHLRSFFRGVLSDLTIPDAPQRYGPSGGRLESATGTAVQGRG